MNAIATPATETFALKGERLHRTTCKRLTGTTAAVTADDAAALLSEGDAKTAACCKPRIAARPAVMPVLEGSVTPTSPHGVTRLSLVAPAEEAPAATAAEEGERVDSTDRKVTLRHDGATFAARYVERRYRAGAVKPYAGRWVLENGAVIAGGPAVGYTLNGKDAGKGPLGAVAAAAYAG